MKDHLEFTYWTTGNEPLNFESSSLDNQKLNKEPQQNPLGLLMSVSATHLYVNFTKSSFSLRDAV